MHDVVAYRIVVRGAVDENELNSRSPLQIGVVAAEDARTEMRVQTDQSGLVGLIRHLHGRGYVLVSILKEEVVYDSP